MIKTSFFCFIACILMQSFLQAQPCPLNANLAHSAVCAGFQTTVIATGANTYTWTGTTITSPVFSQSIAAGPGTYTVTGDTHTCSTVVTVNLMPPINVQVSQSSATTCLVHNTIKHTLAVKLLASGASDYTWYPMPPVIAPPPAATFEVRPSVTSCYTVVGSIDVCSNTAVACVTVVPQFTIAVTPPLAAICEGDSVSLSVSQVGPGANGPPSAFVYFWSVQDSSLNTYHAKTVVAGPSVSTSYTVSVADASLCISSPFQASVTVNNCTGLQTQELKEAAIFPNPFSGYLDIMADDITLIEVTDILGKKVLFSEPWPDKTFRIYTGSLLPGFYFVTLTKDSLKSSVIKVLKE